MIKTDKSLKQLVNKCVNYIDILDVLEKNNIGCASEYDLSFQDGIDIARETKDIFKLYSYNDSLIVWGISQVKVFDILEKEYLKAKEDEAKAKTEEKAYNEQWEQEKLKNLAKKYKYKLVSKQ